MKPFYMFPYADDALLSVCQFQLSRIALKGRSTFSSFLATYFINSAIHWTKVSSFLFEAFSEAAYCSQGSGETPHFPVQP